MRICEASCQFSFDQLGNVKCKEGTADDNINFKVVTGSGPLDKNLAYEVPPYHIDFLIDNEKR